MAKQGEATLLLKIKEIGGEVLDRLVITFEDIGRVIGVVTDYVANAVTQFKEQERAVNMLNQSMINAGTYSAELQQEYLAQAAALQKVTLFTDDQINSAQALLQANVGNRKVTEDLLKATLDLAQAKGMDLASAANLVGKAIAGEADVFKRYGIEVDVSAAKGDKLVAVTEALTEKFGGQAEAARQGTGGIDGFKISMDELAESIGSRLAPKVAALAEALIPIIDKITGWIDAGNLAKQTTNQLNQSIGEMQLQILALLNKRGNPMFDAAQIEREIDYLTEKILEAEKLRDKELADQATAKANADAAEKQNDEKKLAEWQERQLRKQEMSLTMNQLEADLLMAQQEGNDLRELEIKQKMLESKYKSEKDYTDKINLLKEMEANQNSIRQKKAADAQLKLDVATQNARVNVFTSAMNLIASAAENGSKEAFYAQKAAALVSAYVAMQQAAAMALATPPAPNLALAGLAKAAGAMNIGAIAASTLKLAEGGLVMPRAGGVQATIAEAGQPEVVIPLDRMAEFGVGGGGGNNITLNVYGGMLGDERTATELAVAIDRKLLELRQNGGSVAFDRID